MDKCLALLLLISVSVSGGMIRQPPAPAWSIDLTDSVRRTDGVSLLEMTSRKERTRRDCAGKEFDWILSFRNPEKKAPHGYLLLLDCGEIISEIKVNGKKEEMIRPFKPYWRTIRSYVLKEAYCLSNGAGMPPNCWPLLPRVLKLSRMMPSEGSIVTA